MKGSYILLIKLEEDKNIRIGKLGSIFFKKGYYAYIGSALNGINQRVNRHLKKNKKMHWHIDYLLKHSEIIKIYFKESKNKEECKISKSFINFKQINGFGCSDCKCNSHLFFSSDKKNLMQNLKKLKVLPKF